MRALPLRRLASAALPRPTTGHQHRLTPGRPLPPPLAMHRTAAAGSDADRAAAAAAASAAFQRTTGHTPPASPYRASRRVPGPPPRPPPSLFGRYLAALESRPVVTKALTCFVGE
jgi:hypothetical protein